MIFLEKSHTYLNDDGIIIPSVTQLISWKFGSGYEDVPKEVLQAKASYGTRIHALVEEYCKKGIAQWKTPLEATMLNAYTTIAKKLPKVIGNEIMVCFDNRLAGTLDLLYEDGTAGDIKTYYQLTDHSWLNLRWQISLYLFCKYGRDMDKYPVNHLVYLPRSLKDFGHYAVDQLHSYDECLSLLQEYEAEHSDFVQEGGIA